MNIGKIIRKARESKGVSIRSLATELEISASYLCYVELGRKRASESFLTKVAPYLDLDVVYLLAIDGRISSNLKGALKTNPEIALKLEKFVLSCLDRRLS